MEQPGDAYCHRVAFVVRLIDLFADKTMLCSGDILLGCLPTAGKQLFDGGWGDFFINCAVLLPCDQISNAHHLEQRLRFVRESGEPFFPHEHVDVFR